MNEAIRAANIEGTKAIEAAPASIVGLGVGAVTSSASTPTIIITAIKRATDAYLPVPAILAYTCNTDTELAKPLPNKCESQTDHPKFEAALFLSSVRLNSESERRERSRQGSRVTHINNPIGGFAPIEVMGSNTHHYIHILLGYFQVYTHPAAWHYPLPMYRCFTAWHYPLAIYSCFTNTRSNISVSCKSSVSYDIMLVV